MYLVVYFINNTTETVIYLFICLFIYLLSVLSLECELHKEFSLVHLSISCA